MSFEVLEYPIKNWIVDIIDDKQIKSEIFDLLGDPDVDIRYPSMILYKIDDVDLISHDPHHLVAKLEKIQRVDDYKFDLKEFVRCQTVMNQLVAILREADAVLKFIIKHTEDSFVSLFELDKLSVKLVNGMKLELCYSGKDTIISEKIKSLYQYGFVTKIVYDTISKLPTNPFAGHESDDDINDTKEALNSLNHE